MANCKKFQDLLPLEKSIFIGKIVHSVSNSDKLFELGEKIIKLAEKSGLFDGVVIHPIEETDLTIPQNLN